MKGAAEARETARRALRALVRGSRAPASTYRVQLGPGFGFRAAAGVVRYLADLGVDAAYFSPYLKAAPGGGNAYAIVDPAVLDPALGTTRDYDLLCGRLAAARMGHIMDVVPNHMGVGGDANPYWADVLARGRESRWAEFFDIDWEPAKAELKGKVMLPVLEDFYGRVLEKGLIRAVWSEGRLHVEYRGMRFPACAASWSFALERALEEQPGRLPAAVAKEVREVAFHAALGDSAEASRRLVALERRSEAARRFLAASSALLGLDFLHDLLERQHWRLAHWRAASDEINYRRFFDCNDLAAVKMENEDVFEFCHRLVFRLLEEGRVTGLRIDHPDGLYDPPEYFRRLQEGWMRRKLAIAGVGPAEAAAALADPEFAGASPLFVAVEKILDRREPLPSDWRVAGTVGYDALSAFNGLFVDRSAEEAMTAAYERFIGRKTDFETLTYESKRRFLKSNMAGEIEALGRRLDAISERSRDHRDFTRRSLTAALRETIECFPVYRTYVSPRDRAPSERDARYVRVACAKARSAAPELGPEVFDFIEKVLLLDVEEGLRPDERRLYRDFVMRFQQLTAPAMAKGLEDTAFYIDHRLISLNEVGGDPSRFGATLDDFHRLNLERARRWPAGMTAGSTHDTKRSEDARMRVSALSELPEDWRRESARWAVLNEKHKTLLGGGLAPDRDVEYFLYQTLVAVWPDEDQSDAQGRAFARRIRDYARKSEREAKRRTGWSRPDAEYEAAVDRFVVEILRRADANAFLREFVPFQRRVAALGRLNSLSSLALRLGSPGVFDLYQGDEVWNYKLVDPDNRAPVDFRARAAALASVRAEMRSSRPRAEVVAELLASAEDGRIKLLILHEGLEARGRLPGLFVGGDYAPLRAEGPRAGQIAAFLRRAGDRTLVAAAVRFHSRLTGSASDWEATSLVLPRGETGALRDLFTHRRVRPVHRGGALRIPASELFSPLGAALLLGGR